MGGGGFLGILTGLGERFQEENTNLLKQEMERRKGLTAMYGKLAQDPSLPPDRRQAAAMRAFEIQSLPGNKKLSKEHENPADILAPRQVPYPPMPDVQPSEMVPEGAKAPPPPPPRNLPAFYTLEEMTEQDVALHRGRKQAEAEVGEEFDIRERERRQREGEAMGLTGAQLAQYVNRTGISATSSKLQKSSFTYLNEAGVPTFALGSFDPSTGTYYIGDDPIDPSRFLAPGPLRPQRKMTPQGEKTVYVDATGAEVYDPQSYTARVMGTKRIHPITGEVYYEPHVFSPGAMRPPQAPTEPAQPGAKPSAAPAPSGARPTPGPPPKPGKVSKIDAVIDTLAAEVEQRGAQVMSSYTKAQRIAVLNRLKERGTLLADDKDKENIVQIGKVFDDLQVIRARVGELKKLPLLSEAAARKAIVLHGLRQGLGRVMTRKVFLEVGNLSASDVNAGLAPLPGAPSAVAWSKLADEKLDALEDIVKRMQSGYVDALRGGFKIDKETGKVSGPGIIRDKTEETAAGAPPPPPMSAPTGFTASQPSLKSGTWTTTLTGRAGKTWNYVFEGGRWVKQK